MIGIENYRAVRWTVTDPRGEAVVQEVLVPAVDANDMARALVAFYDPARPRQQMVPISPGQKQIPAPDLRARLARIEQGTPVQTNGFWWTSPNLQNDQDRARIVDWQWNEVELELRPGGEA